MSTATLTSKGQLTLPKSVRDRLRLNAGDKVEFVESGSGFVLRVASQDIRTLKGILPKPSRPVSIETMNRDIRSRSRR